MNPNCRKIQDLLASEGPAALRRDESAQQHLAECESCYGVLESLSVIERGFGELSSFDAPDAVVDALLARPELAAPAAASSSPGERLAAIVAHLLRPRPLVWGAVATVFLGVLTIGLFRQSDHPRMNRAAPASEEVAQGVGLADEAGALAGAGAGPQRDAPEKLQGLEVATPRAETELGKKGDEVIESRLAAVPMPVEPPASADNSDAQPKLSELDFVEKNEEKRKRAEPGRTGSRGSQSSADSKDDESAAFRDGKAGLSRGDADGIKRQVASEESEVTKEDYWNAPIVGGEAGVSSPALIEESRVAPEHPRIARAARVEATVFLKIVVRADGSVLTREVLTCNRPKMGFEEAAIAAVEQWRFIPAAKNGEAVDAEVTVAIEFKLGDDEGSSLDSETTIRNARAFLDGRAATDGLTFKRADGYWSNSYVPGDPGLRLLQARLAGWDRSALAGYLLSTPRLHDASRRVGQPFDNPDGSALAVYLHGDRRTLAGPGRMLVQVGLEGTPRQGGRRPAMNLALVLDLRNEIAPETAIRMRALLEAFNRAKEPGDRFRVFAAGRPGGCVVQPDEFRHGFLKVTLDRLVAAPPHGADLVDTLAAAITSVATADDPAAPLGSNAVVLITAGSFGDRARSLADLAHQGAVNGATTSVIGMGEHIDLRDIDLVTLAGQGHRRLLDTPSSAVNLVDRELSAASRAVARAVRLRIRLAPGVQLIDVFGSERLDERRAQRVREAERSIDLRLSRNLGIEADRGDDEDGIQLVIPSFYAGDSHVILLDVLVPGPGAVADVTVRYKDLAHLRNGIARAGLAVKRGDRGGHEERSWGPLERNVLKNLLAIDLSQTLDEAGQALRAGDTTRSISLLNDFAALLQGLRHEIPAFEGDRELLRDIAMLIEYRTLLAGDVVTRPDQRTVLADSLLYAARLKVLPRPAETPS